MNINISKISFSNTSDCQSFGQLFELVSAEFKTSQQINACVVDTNGEVAECDSDVYAQGGNQVGVIGQGGQSYARLESSSTWLKVQTGSHTCKLSLPTTTYRATSALGKLVYQ